MTQKQKEYMHETKRLSNNKKVNLKYVLKVHKNNLAKVQE